MTSTFKQFYVIENSKPILEQIEHLRKNSVIHVFEIFVIINKELKTIQKLY